MGSLVGADVGDQGGRRSVPGHQLGVPSTASAHRNPWKAEISISSRPIIRATTRLQGEVDVVGQHPLLQWPPVGPVRAVRPTSASGRSPSGPASRRSGPRWPGARRRCPGPRTTCGRDRPGRRNRHSSRAWASNSPLSMWAMAVPVMSSSKQRGKSGTGRSRSMPPNPSTVPMRVRALMVGRGPRGGSGTSTARRWGSSRARCRGGRRGWASRTGRRRCSSQARDGRPPVLGAGRDVLRPGRRSRRGSGRPRRRAVRRCRGRPAAPPR